MTFPSIRLEGAIISGDLLDAITREDKHSQKPTHFGLESGAKVKDDIASTWATAKALWTAYQSKLESLRPGATGTTETRNLFISPLLAPSRPFSPLLAPSRPFSPSSATNLNSPKQRLFTASPTPSHTAMPPAISSRSPSSVPSTQTPPSAPTSPPST
jgi:hypothetical protein